MRRVALAFLLAACWHASAPAPTPAPAAPPVKQVAVVDETNEPAPCYRFDAHNPVCNDECPRDAPVDWPSCVEATRLLLVRGYACTSNSPWSCTPPPPKPPCPPASQCPPVHARVIGIRVDGSDLVVTIGAGTNQGITASWRATLADTNHNPIPNGAITIDSVGSAYTTGRVKMTPDQLRNTPYVLLEP